MPDAKHLGPAEDDPNEQIAAQLQALEAQLKEMPSQLADDFDPHQLDGTQAVTDPVPAPPAVAPAPPTPPAPVPPVAPAPPARYALPQPQPTMVAEPPPMRLNKPEPPDEIHFRSAKALTVGYWMSVGVGAVGQIASFGSLIAEGLDGKMKILAYVAAALGAAFAEITMIGAGASALKRRYAGGKWLPLLVVACIVCSYATILNVLHWGPIQVGLAVMFGGGSLVGFAAHTMAEHLAAKDYEIELGEYNAALAEHDAKTEAAAASLRRAQEKAIRESVKAPEPQPVQHAVEAQPKPAQPGKGKAKKDDRPKLTSDEALTWSAANGEPGPAEINKHFEALGYAPVDTSTIRRWRQQVNRGSK